MNDKAATWPATIWLQNPDDEEFKSSMFGEICWCDDQIHKTDVAYVRGDLAMVRDAVIEECAAMADLYADQRHHHAEVTEINDDADYYDCEGSTARTVANLIRSLKGNPEKKDEQ